MIDLEKDGRYRLEKDKRKNMEIWRDIQRKIGINPDIWKESINYASFTRKELLKLEKAVDKFISEKNGKRLN